MSTYEYNPIDLSTDAIRLVRLFSDGDEQSPIRCEMFETFLHEVEGVPYDALSYTWGNPSPGFEISLNGRRHAITPNLHQALRFLRSNEKDRIIWIDAICIDQSNYQERGHQVNQMRLIYLNAQDVLVWLGPGSPETDSLMDWVYRLDHRVIHQPDYRRSSIASWYRVFWDMLEGLEDDNIEYAIPSLCSEQRDLLPMLYQSPWFHRIWIIQEVASARTATIIHGRKSVSSRTFSLIPILMKLGVDEGTQAVLDVMPGPLRGSGWWKERRDLETLLVKFYTRQASDPLDKIYALLGICSDPVAQENIRPNYRLSEDAVVQKIIALRLFPNTEISRIERLQSQIPRWDLETFISKLSTLQSEIFIWSLLGHRKELLLALLPDVPAETLLNEIPLKMEYQQSLPVLGSQDEYFIPIDAFDEISHFRIHPLVYLALRYQNEDVVKAVVGRLVASSLDADLPSAVRNLNPDLWNWGLVRRKLLRGIPSEVPLGIFSMADP